WSKTSRTRQKPAFHHSDLENGLRGYFEKSDYFSSRKGDELPLSAVPSGFKARRRRRQGGKIIAARSGRNRHSHRKRKRVFRPGKSHSRETTTLAMRMEGFRDPLSGT